MTLSEIVAAYEQRQTIRQLRGPVLTLAGHACVETIRAQRQQPLPLTREDLERIAEKWGVPIDDLWPAIDAQPDPDDDVDAVDIPALEGLADVSHADLIA